MKKTMTALCSQGLLCKPLLGVLIISIVLLYGCSQVEESKTVEEEIDEKEIVCSFPYIRHGTDCCWDRNNNNVCDEYETAPVVTETAPVVTVPVPEETVKIQEQCSLPSGIECVEFRYRGNAIEMTIKNKAGFDMAGIDISIEGEDCSAKAAIGSLLEDGQQASFRLVCSPASGAFQGKLRFIYTERLTGEYYNQVGEIMLNVP